MKCIAVCFDALGGLCKNGSGSILYSVHGDTPPAKSANNSNMPIMIADSNALRNPGLKQFLAASRGNHIALPDTILIEMRKRNALSTSRDSMFIVSQFLGQVFVLKQTHMILDYNVGVREDVDALFDYPATIELQSVCRDLKVLPTPQELRDYMAEQELVATSYVAELTKQVERLEMALVSATNLFKPDQIKQLRTGEGVTEPTKRIILKLWIETAAIFIIDNQPRLAKGKFKLSEAKGTFAYRYSLCMVIYYIMWVRQGRQTGKKVHLRVNDIIDMQLAALSTYFNGMLTADQLPFETALAARGMIGNHGGYLGDLLMSLDAAQTSADRERAATGASKT